MTELTPADVLADLFDSVDFEPVAHDPRHAADIVLKRLTDAGFEVRSAWPVEAKDTVTPHECWPAPNADPTSAPSAEETQADVAKDVAYFEAHADRFASSHRGLVIAPEDTPFFECPGCGIDCANPSEQHKPSCPRGGWQMNLTDEQVMVGAKALMNIFIKKWFLGSYKGPVYLDCVNGEMAWLDEARACLTAAVPRAERSGDGA